ncbi:MAG: endolytic transglycosylase MltG [Gemmatimonadaceae bacterium]
MRRAALALALVIAGGCSAGDTTEVMVNVRRGSSFREAADSLAAHGVVRYPRLFGFYASRTKRDRTIRYGTYLISRGASWKDILTALEQGRGIVHRVRIIEGWAVWDIVPAIAEGLSVPVDSVEAAVRDTAQMRRMGVPRSQRTLEGYLFPDTYHFPDGVNARQAVDLMLRRFEFIWKPTWDARLAELNLSRHEIVTLASIIEKEVRRGEERPLVSAVYHNRLKVRMLLQADPTVQYALGRRRPTRVLYRDLRVDSPYNTYRRRGLPPGPIASPGASSIEAALFPANVPYLFFVAHPDGHHEFRRTHREHLAAIVYVREVARREAAARRAQLERAARDSIQAATGSARESPDSVAAQPPGTP